MGTYSQLRSSEQYNKGVRTQAMLKFSIIFLLSILTMNANARGSNYCTSDVCRGNGVWLIFGLGFFAIFFIVYGKESVKKIPRVSFFIKWLIFSIVAMFAALVVQAEVLNLRNALGMLMVALTGYGVFWYGISAPLRRDS